MIKILNKVGIERLNLNIVKAIENKTTANIHISEKLKAFFQNQEQEKDVHLPRLFNIGLEVIPREIRQEKRVSTMENWK